MTTVVQSIIVDKNIYSKSQAISFVKEHFKFKKLDTTENFYRFRQVSPETLLKKGYKNYRIKEIHRGVKLVLAVK